MFFKNLVEKYKSRYTIPYLDLADAGESNRLIVHIASIALLVFSIFCLVFFAITLYPNYGNYIARFTYYTVFLIFSIYAFFASKQGKEVNREKAYIKKTIPFYVAYGQTIDENDIMFFRQVYLQMQFLLLK